MGWRRHYCEVVFVVCESAEVVTSGRGLTDGGSVEREFSEVWEYDGTELRQVVDV